ncbi:hypothetical protein BESB_033520 [Besnoitia besnoiti]|uniref:Uncharacterized protein n=1 Tax=Besnoitia besnoiti TaxID=94643 RepID=A0A2A9MI64_BESBE|nr:hypothetical protein BESB_033520 [Besnoitia besnoiti]PFH36894.1 hypothetical protein BESB_033520 [Besnoitia besnoiti]
MTSPSTHSFVFCAAESLAGPGRNWKRHLDPTPHGCPHRETRRAAPEPPAHPPTQAYVPPRRGALLHSSGVRACSSHSDPFRRSPVVGQVAGLSPNGGPPTTPSVGGRSLRQILKRYFAPEALPVQGNAVERC